MLDFGFTTLFLLKLHGETESNKFVSLNIKLVVSKMLRSVIPNLYVVASQGTELYVVYSVHTSPLYSQN